MYQHVVLFRYGQEVGEDVHRRIHDYAERIRSSLDGIVSYAYCRNLNAKSADYPYARIVAAFDSVESFAAYAAAPIHRRLVEFSMQYIGDIAIHDFDSGAGIVEKAVGSAEGDAGLAGGPRPAQSADGARGLRDLLRLSRRQDVGQLRLQRPALRSGIADMAQQVVEAVDVRPGGRRGR